MFTARAATSAAMSRRIIASVVISNFARGVKGSVSVGEIAMAMTKIKNDQSTKPET